MYVYHYHAVCRDPESPRLVEYCDGVASSAFKVRDQDDYCEIKAQIARKMAARPDPERVTIQSLTLLHDRDE